jgi:adenosylhomocysteine nucleosidase
MKIGIIGAMDVEVNHLKQTMHITKTTTVAGQEYCEGTIGETEVVVVKCGVGKVRAGMSVQVLNDLFHVTHIINTGVAGSLNNDLNIGDVLVSKDAVYHDVDATNFGYALGEVPSSGCLYYEADAKLREAAVDAVKNAAGDVNVIEGRVASGDQFIRTKEKKAWIKENFNADCCEMEGCAIAQASYLNQIPFVIIRAISDKADESVQESYDVFEGKAAEHCAKIVAYMLKKI